MNNHNLRLWAIAEGKRQNGRKVIEKSGLSHMRSFVIVIRSAYFGPQKRRKYAKSIGVNRSAVVQLGLCRTWSKIPKTNFLMTLLR